VVNVLIPPVKYIFTRLSFKLGVSLEKILALKNLNHSDGDSRGFLFSLNVFSRNYTLQFLSHLMKNYRIHKKGELLKIFLILVYDEI